MLLALFTLNSVCLLLAHITLSRLNLKFGWTKSGQKLLLGIFAGVVLFDVTTLFFFFSQSFSFFEQIYLLLLILLSLYVYFHVFNMSETARRIKILITIDQDVYSSAIDYSRQIDEPIKNRLERLKLLNQIEEVGGGLYLKSRLLLNLSKLISFFGNFYRAGSND
jgi:hypothetical protein